MECFTAFRIKLFYPYDHGAEYVLLIRRFCGETKKEVVELLERHGFGVLEVKSVVSR